jgi:Tol biopolymer transport system component
VTPDGRSVLFVSSNTPWIVSLDGGPPRRIATFFAGVGSVAVSPDGTSIAFWSYDELNQRMLRTCALPGCESSQAPPAPPSQGRLRYTPDGHAIAYLDPAATNIWLLPLAGDSPRQLTHFTDGATIGNFAWSRDGKRLAVSRSTVANDIVLFKGLRR